MAELVRFENDLPTIRILLGGTVGSRSDVIFEIVRGKGEGHEITRCTTSDLGLPDGPMPELRMADDCRLPKGVLRALKMAVNRPSFAFGPTSDAIWLELPSPRGYLHLVPWERLLVALERPVLRLPYHTLRPQASANTLEVVLCASSPSAKAGFDTATVLADMTNAWLYHAGHAVTLHLFTDVIGYKDTLALAANRPAVVVHDPHTADAYDEPAPTTSLSDSTAVTSPWLRWIQAELKGQAVDVLHFVTHGYLSGQRGAIAFAGSPTHNVDTRLARFVGAAEMSSFVGQVGAWALVLGGPPRNFSPVGLREFADSSALQRPGATIVHELELDPSGKDFTKTVEMVFAGWSPPMLHPMPGVTCWVHPEFVEYPHGEQEALHLTQSGHSSLILQATENIMASGATPAWVAASTRFLETQQSDWLPDSPDQGVHPAAASALESVSSLLEQHVNKHLAGGKDLL